MFFVQTRMAKRVLYVVTGASRGLGAEFVRAVQEQQSAADLLLISRNAAPHCAPAGVGKVECASIDLGDLEFLESRLSTAFGKVRAGS